VIFTRFDFDLRFSYCGWEREGRIQSAERAVPTLWGLMTDPY